MIDVAEIEQSIEGLLKAPLYGQTPDERYATCCRCCRKNWLTPASAARAFAITLSTGRLIIGRQRISPTYHFFRRAPSRQILRLHSLEAQAIVRTLASSSTSGQVPSRIVLDRATARRMTRSLAAIIRDFAGAERRPYLVVDTPDNLAPHSELERVVQPYRG